VEVLIAGDFDIQPRQNLATALRNVTATVTQVDLSYVNLEGLYGDSGVRPIEKKPKWGMLIRQCSQAFSRRESTTDREIKCGTTR